MAFCSLFVAWLRLWVGVFGFALVAAPLGAQQLGVPLANVRLETAHYTLFASGVEGEAQAFGEVLEQAWPEIERILKGAPVLEKGQRLDVRVLANRDHWLQVMLNDGQIAPSAADPVWFSTANRVMYTYRQASPAFTRMMLLYGAVLQFHGLTKTKNLSLDAAWYVHGLAQTLSVHYWDGRKLELGVRPRLCMVDYPAKALAVFGGANFVFDSKNELRMLDPYANWATVRFALYGAQGKYLAKYQKLALGYTGSRVSGADFLRSLGTERAIGAEFHDWLVAEQYPFEIVHGEWEDHSDGRVTAEALGDDKLAGLVTRTETPGLSVAISGIATKPNGAPNSTKYVVLAWKSAHEYVVARFEPPWVIVQCARRNQEVDLRRFLLPNPAADVVFVELTRLPLHARPILKDPNEWPGGTALTIDGKAFGRIAVPEGRFGIGVRNGRAEFSRLGVQ